jgi:tetratricopeptide (TPR) repeat protein
LFASFTLVLQKGFYRVRSVAGPLLALMLVVSSSGRQAGAPRSAEDVASARRLFKQGKFQDAAAAYRTMVEKDRSSGLAYAGLIQSYLKMDDVAAADDAANQALHKLPQSAIVHAVRGDVYFRQGLLAEAESEYRAGLALDKNCARAELGMGKLYSAVADNRRAKEHFARAHELDPDDGDALYRWAVLLPYPESANQLEKHLSEYHSTPQEERREREFIGLVRGIGDREVWVGPEDIKPTEIRLEQLSPRPGMLLGLGVQVKFPNNARATLLLDTGANWMTIPQKLAGKIGARKIAGYASEGVGDAGPAGGYFAWVDRISVGDVEFHDCVVHVITKSDVSDVDGVTGTNIFAKYWVTIHFPERKLLLEPLPEQQTNEGERVVPRANGDYGLATFSFGHVLLLNTLVNNSGSGLFVLDSGANVSSISPQLAGRVGKLSQSHNRITGMSGAVNDVSVLQDAVLKFASVAEPKHDLTAFDPHALSQQLGTEVSGFIGFDLLSRMTVRINYRDGEIAIGH